MTAALHVLAVQLAVIALESALAWLLAGRGRRRATLAAAVWGNLTFEPLCALLASGGGAAIPGLVVAILGESAVCATLSPQRAANAFAIAGITNIASGFALVWLA